MFSFLPDFLVSIIGCLFLLGLIPRYYCLVYYFSRYKKGFCFWKVCQSSFESHFIITTITTTTTTATIVPYRDLLCLLTLSNSCVCLLIPYRHLVTVFMDIIMNIFLWFVPYALVAVISFAVTTMGWSVVDGLVSPSTGQVNSSTPRARRSPQYLPDMESSNQSKDNSTVGQWPT